MKSFKKIYLEITNICNLNCDFCIKNTRKSKYMSYEEFKNILNKIKPYTNYLYFHLLGEPLMHPNINEFIDYAHNNNFNINITTNGYLIDKIKNNKNIRQLNISLHSFNPKYNITIAEYMKKILEISEILAENGTYISFRFWVDNPFSKEVIDNINSYFKTNIVLKDISNNIMVRKNIFINKFHLFDWPDLNNNFNNEKGTCYGLIDHIGILCDGTVVPCCLDTKGNINLGNILKNSLDEILNKERTKNIITGFKNNHKCEKLCQKCNFIDK